MAIYQDQYQPYFYIIQDVRNGMYYAGAKWSKNANPSNFMIEGGYETTSKTIKELIRQHGLNNFIVRKIRTFETGEEAHDYETRFLVRVDARNHPRFYNGHNNDGYMNVNKMKQIMLELYGVENPMQSPIVIDRYKQTSLERYGVPIPSQSEIVKQKMVQANLEKRGVEYPMQCEEVKQTLQKNNLETHGVENVFQSEQIKDKIKKTHLEKRGVEYPMQCEEVKQKAKITKKEKYGDENYVNVEQIRKTKEERYGDPGYTNKEKAMSTNNIRYGGNAPASSPEVVNKMKRTSMERYGAESYSQSDEGRRVNILVKKNKRNREIVSLILQMTTQKQRGEMGLGRGWYQKSDEYLQEVYFEIINQQKV